MNAVITLANDNLILIVRDDGYEYFVKEDYIAVIPVKYVGDYVYVGEFLRGVYSLSSGVNPENIMNSNLGLYSCPICGEWDIAENMVEIRSSDGEYAHQNCVENSADYFECEVCGEYCHYDHESGDYGICDRCSENYTRCSSCGAIIDFDEVLTDDWGDRYCEDCYNEIYPPRNIFRYDYLINNYHYKPELVFHYEPFERDNPLFLGLEIECEPLQDWEDMLTRMNGHYNSEDTCFLKYDGSVHDGAVEVVFQPRTLASFFEEGVLEDLYSDEVITEEDDGMHIHLNRDYFKSKEEIINFIDFFQENKEFIFKFSERSWDKFRDWADFYPNRERYLSARLYDHGERYFCVNITNEETIEVRIFAAPSDINTAYANMQFVYAVAMLSKYTFDSPEERWNRFLEIARHFEYLWNKMSEIGFTKKKFIPASRNLLAV